MAFLLLLICCYAVFHEATHYVICHIYDVDDVSFGFCSFGDGMAGVCTKYTYPADMPSDKVNMMNLAHSINEVVGYSIVPFLILIYHAIIMGWLNQDDKNNNSE